MIISRKVAVSAIMSVLAFVGVWAADHYLGIVLTTEQAMGVLIAIASSAGWLTKEDARVAGELKLRGRHRQVTVGELVEQREQDRADGLYETSAYPAIER